MAACARTLRTIQRLCMWLLAACALACFLPLPPEVRAALFSLALMAAVAGVALVEWQLNCEAAGEAAFVSDDGDDRLPARPSPLREGETAEEALDRILGGESAGVPDPANSEEYDPFDMRTLQARAWALEANSLELQAEDVRERNPLLSQRLLARAKLLKLRSEDTSCRKRRAHPVQDVHSDITDIRAGINSKYLSAGEPRRPDDPEAPTVMLSPDPGNLPPDGGTGTSDRAIPCAEDVPQ